jgi:hypothetical protein
MRDDRWRKPVAAYPRPRFRAIPVILTKPKRSIDTAQPLVVSPQQTTRDGAKAKIPARAGAVEAAQPARGIKSDFVCRNA